MTQENAGFWIRLGANILDGIVVGLPTLLLVYLFIQDGSLAKTVSNWIMFFYGLLLPVFWGGSTVGKRMCGIRIQKLDGSPPGLRTMLLRDVVGGIVYAVTFGICALISAFMVGLREDKRAIHDFIAGTEVVHT